MMISTGQTHRLNDGTIQEKFHIGYVVGINYNSEGTIIEWLLNKKGEMKGYSDTSKVCKTMKQAENLRDKYHKDNKRAYIRKYYYWKTGS